MGIAKPVLSLSKGSTRPACCGMDVLCEYTAVFVPNAVWIEVQHHRPQALQHAKVIRPSLLNEVIARVKDEW